MANEPEQPLNKREQWRLNRIRELDEDFDLERAIRRARVTVLFELEYRQFLAGAVPFPRQLAAALLRVRDRDLVIRKLPITDYRPFVDGLQEQRGYVLDDPSRLVDLVGIDPIHGWDGHCPFLFGVDETPDDDAYRAIYGGDE